MVGDANPAQTEQPEMSEAPGPPAPEARLQPRAPEPELQPGEGADLVSIALLVFFVALLVIAVALLALPLILG